MALSICNSTTDLYQKELLSYGDAAFPIACYEDDLNTVLVPWHWHDEWEFIFVETGSAAVLLETAQLCIPAGDGLFINACALHAIDHSRSRDAVLHSAVFHPRLIGGGADSVFWQRLVLPLSHDSAPDMCRCTGPIPTTASCSGIFMRHGAPWPLKRTTMKT